MGIVAVHPSYMTVSFNAVHKTVLWAGPISPGAYSGEIGSESEANRQWFRRKSALREVGAKRRWEFVHSL